MKDVILIGLGSFGEKTIELYNEIESERKSLLPQELRDEINVYPLVYKNNNSFNYTKVTEDLTRIVAASDSKNSKNHFSYVFIGDLYEDITSNYAIDYAMISLILDQNNILLRDKDNVLGFFTFSDMLETQIKCTPEKMTSILNFFKKIEKIDVDNYYSPEYKNISGNKIQRIECPMGPFSRNYIVVTPGDQDAVMTMTSQIFAERIFYELYYLLDEYKEKANKIQAQRAEKSKNCFSSFTMAQVSRIEELQKYYLSYCLEDLVTDYLLREEVKGTNLDVIENKFLSMLDIIDSDKESTYSRNENGYDISFPIDRAVKLFKHRYKNDLKGLIPSYIKQEYKDNKQYINICKQRINDKIYDLKTYYDDFVKDEIINMHEQLEKGYVSLFKIEKLTGNIHAYIKYVEDLKNIFDSWTKSLRDIVNSKEEINLDKDYERIQYKINSYQKSFIYKLPFFRPARRMLINNAILELPINEYIEREIKYNLANAFLKQWEDTSPNSYSPVHNCETVIQDLQVLKERLENKKKMISHKKDFISKIPSHYYIISQLKQDEYNELLKKVYDKKFSAANQPMIESVSRDLFKRWTIKGEGIQKDRQDITKEPIKFIKHVDSYIFDEARKIFGMVDMDASAYEEYASTSVTKMEERVKRLSENSFHTQNPESHLSENKILFKPELKVADSIDEKLENLPTSTKKILVNKDFTLGAVVYFQDYLYMEYKQLKHYDVFLKKYENEKFADLVYAEPGTVSEDDKTITFEKPDSKNLTEAKKVLEKESAKDTIENTKNEKSEIVDDDELDIFNLHSRMLLNEYFDEDFRKNLFKEIFGKDVDKLSMANINAIAKNSNLTELLGKMDIEKVHEYAASINLEDIVSDKQTQIEIIINYLESAAMEE